MRPNGRVDFPSTCSDSPDSRATVPRPDGRGSLAARRARARPSRSPAVQALALWSPRGGRVGLGAGAGTAFFGANGEASAQTDRANKKANDRQVFFILRYLSGLP